MGSQEGPVAGDTMLHPLSPLLLLLLPLMEARSTARPDSGVGGGGFCAQVICCGSDGITYPTPCSTPYGVTCVDFNECPTKTPDDVICAQVICCGSDGTTYPTPCHAPDNVTCVDYNQCPVWY